VAIDMWRTRPYGMGTLRQAVDRIFDEALSNTGNTDSGTTGFQSMPVNVWETPEGYQAALLSPGLDQQTINVSVHDETLAIEGELKFEVPEGGKPVWQEFTPARFRRSLRLGAAIDANKVEAIYQNGILLITMPKAEHAKPHQVQVQLAGNGKAG
jgi:HSP20 family protein